MERQLEQIDRVKQYWNVLSSSVSDEFKDHWVDSDGSGLKEGLFEEIAEYLAASIPASGSASVLEVGCGTGRILSQLANRLGESVSLTGIDFSPPQIEAATERLGERADFFAGDLAEFAGRIKENDQFDLIFLHSVTQYFPGDEYFASFLELAHSLLKRGGALVLLDCPINWYKDLMQRQPTGILHKGKAWLKKLLRYERKKMNESIGGIVLNVPIFKGYWADPELVRKFAETRFSSFQMEYQMFRNKPVAYKKFRPNFILSNKTA